MSAGQERPYDLIVYGSYGYTGRLVVGECQQRNLKVLLSGRNAASLQEQSTGTGLPFQAVDIDDHSGLVKLLGQARVVLHCAGPFIQTARQMAAACLEAGTHYLDITGEHQVFSMLAELDQQARARGIVIMPGTGFDVVPTDCMAAYLKQQLPDATQLELAFGMKPTGVSRGTAKTALRSLGSATLMRRGGKLVADTPTGRVKEINFGPFKAPALRISWGDIVTAWHSTGIPNIEVHMAVNDKFLKRMRWTVAFRFLLKPAFVQRFLSRQIDRRAPGPDEQVLKQGRSFIYGKVSGPSGKVREAWMEAGNGYALTAEMSVIIAQKLSHNTDLTGYHTPSSAFGPDLVLAGKGVVRHG